MIAAHAIRQVADAYVERINAHDLEGIAEYLSDDLRVEVATGAKCPMSKAEFLAYNKN